MRAQGKNKDEEVLIEQRWECDELCEEIEIKTVSARFFLPQFLLKTILICEKCT